jgi:hypothetical protein
MQVSPKLLIKAVMGPFSCKIDVHISKGRQEPIRGIAFPVVSISKGEANPVMQREGLPRNKGSKKPTRMAPLHKKRLRSVNEGLCLDCIGVKSPYYAPVFVVDPMGVCPENAVWVRMLDSDEPFYVFWRNPCE